MAVATVCSGAVLSAQPPAPKFEVVSIKARQPGSPRVLLPSGFAPDQPGGRYVAPAVPVSLLIAFAYEVRQPNSRLLGLPAWATTTTDEVSAKAGDDFPQLSFEENRKQVRLMVREMLADRFGLRLHAETRQETVLKMSLDPGGRRLKEVAAPGRTVGTGRNRPIHDDNERRVRLAILKSDRTSAVLAHRC